MKTLRGIGGFFGKWGTISWTFRFSFRSRSTLRSRFRLRQRLRYRPRLRQSASMTLKRSRHRHRLLRAIIRLLIFRQSFRRPRRRFSLFRRYSLSRCYLPLPGTIRKDVSPRRRQRSIMLSRRPRRLIRNTKNNRDFRLRLIRRPRRLKRWCRCSSLSSQWLRAVIFRLLSRDWGSRSRYLRINRRLIFR